jgi:hypothetical protein
MKGHIHSLARFRLGCQGLKVDRGRREGGRHSLACIRCQPPDLQLEGSLVPDTEYHALLSATARPGKSMHCLWQFTSRFT